MKIFNRNSDKEPIFIAEIGVNHEGNINDAKKLMLLAKSAGYHAAKFQIYSTSNFLSSYFGDRVKRAEKYRLSIKEYKLLKLYGKKINLPVFASAISHDVINFLKSDKVIKVASGDIDFNFMLKKLASLNSKIILSIGASNYSEVANAVKIFKKKSNKKLNEKLALLVCTSQYPCPLEDANINRISTLKKFGCTVGYSNHVKEEEASLCAAALGAEIFEFHFTDSRNGKKFHDHLLSFEPNQSKKLFEKIKKIKKALGSNLLKRSSIEEENFLKLRKGLVYKKNLNVGKIILKKDLNFARPAIYYKANEIKKIVGKKLRKKVISGSLVKLKDFL